MARACLMHVRHTHILMHISSHFVDIIYNCYFYIMQRLRFVSCIGPLQTHVCKSTTGFQSNPRSHTNLALNRMSNSNYNNNDDSEVLICSSFGSQHLWKARLEEQGLVVREPGDSKGDMSRVEIAILFNQTPGVLEQCPNLKAIQSLGAGVDFIMEDDTVPKNVPLMRIVDPLMAERMATFCVWAVTNIQRKCDAYYQAQMDSRWDKSVENYKNVDNHEISVGVMGLGVMGGKVAETLSMLGYPVRGWTRTKKTLVGNGNIDLYHGRDQFEEFAKQSQIVINLLPLTPETRGILSRELFSSMPRGGSVLNLARGAHLVANDLLEALESGQLESAVLDVFVKEPLPPTCPFWKHPKVRVFPHMSSVTDMDNGVEQILRNRRLVLNNAGVAEFPPGVLALPDRGY